MVELDNLNLVRMVASSSSANSSVGGMLVGLVGTSTRLDFVELRVNAVEFIVENGKLREVDTSVVVADDNAGVLVGTSDQQAQK